MMHGIKIFNAACKGCVHCIKSCPTEAIRVIDGLVHILPDLCIDCGECLRTCRKKALGLDEDDWRELLSQQVPVLADPSFFAQFAAWSPDGAPEALEMAGIKTLDSRRAFDLAALAVARCLDEAPREELPLISTYCPAVLRLIRIRFPELLSRTVPAESPLEVAAELWAREFGGCPPVLLAPCPAKITMVREPLGRDRSAIGAAVSVRRVVRDLLSSGIKNHPQRTELSSRRDLLWALRGGEAEHVRRFARRPVRAIAVSGLRNTLDVLRDLELGRLQGVDYVECRFCDLGCIGGVANAESRFLAEIRVKTTEVSWDLSEEDREELEHLHASGIWRLRKDIKPQNRLPLGGDFSEAMGQLARFREVLGQLPLIDCGACGRPSCQAMAEDIVRGNAEVTDCVFKLRERIAALAGEIEGLSRNVPHTLRTREKES